MGACKQPILKLAGSQCMNIICTTSGHSDCVWVCFNGNVKGRMAVDELKGSPSTANSPKMFDEPNRFSAFGDCGFRELR